MQSIDGEERIRLKLIKLWGPKTAEDKVLNYFLSENMDAFLNAIGCNWFTRKIFKLLINYEFKIIKSKLCGIDYVVQSTPHAVYEIWTRTRPEKMNAILELTRFKNGDYGIRQWGDNGEIMNDYKLKSGLPVRFKMGGTTDAEVSNFSYKMVDLIQNFLFS